MMMDGCMDEEVRGNEIILYCTAILAAFAGSVMA
jgi:hypothetical protein